MAAYEGAIGIVLDQLILNPDVQVVGGVPQQLAWATDRHHLSISPHLDSCSDDRERHQKRRDRRVDFHVEMHVGPVGSIKSLPWTIEGLRTGNWSTIEAYA